MLERISLLLLLLARWCVSLAVRSAPDGAAVILAVSHGDSASSKKPDFFRSSYCMRINMRIYWRGGQDAQEATAASRHLKNETSHD